MPEPSPYRSVDFLHEIKFLDALVRLHGMLGRHVKVELNDYECFFGCGFEGVLHRIETMPGGAEAISAFVGDTAGFFLDPGDCKAFYVDAGEESWLEFHRDHGPVVAIQAIDPARDADRDPVAG